MIKTTIVAALLSLSALTAIPAQAAEFTVAIGSEWGGSGWHGSGWERRGHWRQHRRHENKLSSDEVRTLLRYFGYRHIRFHNDEGPVYQVSARKRGDFYFLVVSARTGEILSRNRI
jgi:hypothetical protein